MRLSINVTNFSWPDGDFHDRLADVAAAADTAGLDTLWVADHLFQADPNCDIDEPMLEATTTLGFLARASDHVRLGTMVAAVTYRAPAMLIKAATTVDVLSRGRAWLGIGAGYQQQEAAAMGLDLPDVTARYARLEDTLQLGHRMWQSDRSSFEGQSTSLADPVCEPGPVQRPRPPILIGGMGEKKTLRLVAEYADACNLFDFEGAAPILQHKLDVLRAHCIHAGRDFEKIDKTVCVRWEAGETPTDLARRCVKLHAVGLTHVVLLQTGPWTGDDVRSLTTVTERIGSL